MIATHQMMIASTISARIIFNKEEVRTMQRKDKIGEEVPSFARLQTLIAFM
jgi:hypothetical protein